MPDFKCVVAIFIPVHSGLKAGVVGSLCASKILRRPTNNNQTKNKCTQNFNLQHVAVVKYPNSMILKENTSSDSVTFGEIRPGTKTEKCSNCLQKSSEVFMDLKFSVLSHICYLLT